MDRYVIKTTRVLGGLVVVWGCSALLYHFAGTPVAAVGAVALGGIWGWNIDNLWRGHVTRNYRGWKVRDNE